MLQVLQQLPVYCSAGVMTADCLLFGRCYHNCLFIVRQTGEGVGKGNEILILEKSEDEIDFVLRRDCF